MKLTSENVADIPRIKVIGEIPAKYGIDSFVFSDGSLLKNKVGTDFIKYETIITMNGRHKEEWVTFLENGVQFCEHEWHINLDGSCDHTCYCNTKIVGGVAYYYTTKNHIDNFIFKFFKL